MRLPLALGLAVVAGAGLAATRGRSALPVTPPLPTPVPPPGGRARELTTADGVVLHVEEHGATGAAGTVVLVHGYVQSSRLWSGQVRDLTLARPDLRVLVHDHGGHGRSGATGRDAATPGQLADDLAQVLREAAPEGPLVVAGHSLGGMTLMALAERQPDLFSPAGRVVGVAFVATSAGGLDGVTWGLPAPGAALVRRVLPRLNEKVVRDDQRGRTRTVGPWEQRLLFGRAADPAQVREVLAVQAATSAETVAAFLPAFSAHDRAHALAALADVPALVVVGDRDRLCPLPHSRILAAALPRAELVVYPGVGHMVQVERRPEVSRRLLALLDRVLPPAA